jgi:hypothetical protein
MIGRSNGPMREYCAPSQGGAINRSGSRGRLRAERPPRGASSTVGIPADTNQSAARQGPRGRSVCLSGNETAVVDRPYHAARSCLRVFFPVSDDLKRLSCSVRSQCQRRYRRFQPNLRVRMLMQWNECTSLIASSLLPLARQHPFLRTSDCISHDRPAAWLCPEPPRWR